MKVDIIDGDALQSLSSSNALAYLRILGWTQSYVQPGRMAIYHKGEGTEYSEILVPLRSDLADYLSAIHSLIQTVAETEGVSQLKIFKDIQNVNSDIVRVRVHHDSFSDGSIPIEAGSRLVDRAIELFIAGACAADNPKPVYASRRSNQVASFLKEARLGQTEQGSYVVTMKTIVPPMFMDTGGQSVIPDLGIDEPFERRVTKTLANALNLTRTAMTESIMNSSFTPFLNVVKSGVSANLLDSIIGLIQETGAIETEVGLTWSPTRTLEQPLPSVTTFTVADEPLLKSASKALRESSPKPDARIDGFVKILSRVNENAPGTISVRAVVEGKARTVRMRLNAEDYTQALEAHGQWHAIEVNGELVRQGNTYELLDPRDFKLYEADPTNEDYSEETE